MNFNTLIHPEVRYFLMQVFNPYVLTGEGRGLVADDFMQHSRIRLYNRFNVNTPTATFPLRYNAPLFGTPSPITYVPFGWLVSSTPERYWEYIAVLLMGLVPTTLLCDS